MDEAEREELKEAYRKGKDPRVVARMLAVRMVYVRKAGIDETAAHLMRFYQMGTQLVTPA